MPHGETQDPSPKVIRLVVMMDDRFPFSLRNIEDLLLVCAPPFFLHETQMRRLRALIGHPAQAAPALEAAVSTRVVR